MHLVCRCSLPVWRRSFLKKGTPGDLFGPALDPPLGGSGQKTTTLVRDHEYFIPTKFHQNPSSGSWEEVENVKSLQTDDGRTDGRTDDGRCAMTIAHSSLRLRWAKKERHGNKKIIIWFWGKWFRWDSNSRPLILQASVLTTALRKILNWASICPIYRQPIFIINLNTDKTVSMQSELLAFLPTL